MDDLRLPQLLLPTNYTQLMQLLREWAGSRRQPTTSSALQRLVAINFVLHRNSSSNKGISNLSYLPNQQV